MTWKIGYTVRPADPSDRRDAPDAHEVRMMSGERPIRTVGVYTSFGAAQSVAKLLNLHAKGQIR